MKKQIALLTVLFVCHASFSQETSDLCSKRNTFTNSLKYSPYVDATQAAQQQKYDVHFYRLNLSMTNTSTDLSGIVEIHATASQAIDSALLEFYSGFTINDVKVNGASVTYNASNNLLSVPVNQGVGSNFVVQVDYTGTPPTAASNPLGGSGITNDSSPSWGNQVTWSLSEPFSAMEWFPCKQNLKDKADSCQVIVTVPDHLMAGSNGVLDSVIVNGNFKTFHWMHRHSIDYYLISVAVAEYVEYNIYANPTGAAQPILIQNFIYNNPQFLPFFQDDIDETADFLELFSELYGLYPFHDEKYGHCIAPLSGGMEHQTMTTQGFFNQDLTSHELAHQWWGDYVTCGSWADIWINEGFASYSEYLMLENLYSLNDAQSKMADVHANVMSENWGSVWVEDSLNEGAIFSGRLVYDKGSAIVHTLRYLINNDNLFFASLQNFLATYAYGTATGLEFKEFMEQETGLNLNNFFNEWYFGEGFPTYSVEYDFLGSDVLIKVSQNTSSPATTLFTNPIDLRITRSGGLSDTIVRVDITSNETFVQLTGINNFESIDAIDPLNYVINKFGGITENLNLKVDELAAENNEIIVFPNPTKGQLSVNYDGQKPCQLSVINSKGKQVFKTEITSNQTIDLSHLKNGQYLIQLEMNRKKVIRKVIKL